jgi:hypothetical protein
MSLDRAYYFTKYSTLYEEVENVLDGRKKEVKFEYSYITNEFFKAAQAMSQYFTKHKLWKVLKLSRKCTERVIIIKRRN